MGSILSRCFKVRNSNLVLCTSGVVLVWVGVGYQRQLSSWWWWWSSCYNSQGSTTGEFQFNSTTLRLSFIVPYLIKPQTACNRYFHEWFEDWEYLLYFTCFGWVFFTAKNQITSIEIRRKSILRVVWVLVGQMVPILVVDWMHKTVDSCTYQENLRFLLNVTLEITSVLLQIMWLTNSSYFKAEESFWKR